MAVMQLPDFDHTLALSQGNLDAAGLAECHGVACGLLLRRPTSEPHAFLSLLDMLEIVQQPRPALQDALAELLEAAGLQLADEEMGLELWLPDDEQSLESRTEALAQWCNGFMASLGADPERQLETLSKEAGEALSDLQEIARAEVGVGGSGDDREEEEQAFAEIVEYIRVAVLMLREDLRGPQAGDSVH